MIGLKCEICNHREDRNLKYHLKEKHNISTQDYKKMFPKSRTMTGHSKRTLEYWVYRGYSVEQGLEQIKSHQKNGKKIFIENKIKEGNTREQAQTLWNKKQAENSYLSIEYYRKRGIPDLEAQKIISDIQKVNTKHSNKFKGHKHSRESKQQISNSLKIVSEKIGAKNLLKRFKPNKPDSVRSNIEIKCYNELKKHFSTLKCNIPIGGHVVDMLLGNLVIEFYGDFWHRNPKLYKPNFFMYKKTSKQVWERDKKRLSSLYTHGYDAFVIWEYEWKRNKKQVIKTLKQLYENKYKEETD